MWFRRDLRLSDHPALAYAARDNNEVVPLFVIDPALVRHSGQPRLAFMYRSLRALNHSMGGELVVRHGDPKVVLAELAAETGSIEVVVTRDYAPYGRERDAAVAAALAAQQVSFVGKGSQYAVAPGGVLKADGTPYAVFTPFRRTWNQHGWTMPGDVVAANWSGAQRWRCEPIPHDPELQCTLPAAGEDAAHARWDEFVVSGLDTYDQTRNFPAVEGTSMMSAYLRWGQVHPRQLLADLGDSADHETFRSELAWRDFYADVLFRSPQSARQNLQSKMDAIRLDSDHAARERFELWATGCTGYPLVDAGMRQLLATGWMHNRVRMIVASFLVKDLHLPWQWGARHFMRHLVDGDLASNQHGWQWAAGTGTDAAPYFRVFNPTAQSKRFDPDGHYIRRWVPELSSLAAAQIHEPWTSALSLEGHIRQPMVDHAVERADTLSRYQVAMKR
jgi:deoxyribodipyrimidine photo-lyase